ncbi:hypothetical protein Tco_0716240, partial [Tanacetum coccineum]
LWYLKGSGFGLKAYSDSDYVGCNLDKKKVPLEDIRYLEESQYVGMQRSRALWLCHQLKLNMSLLLDDVPIFCDNTSAIAISNNPVLHSRTKHIDIRYHFIRDHILKGDIELYFVSTELQLAAYLPKLWLSPASRVALLDSSYPAYQNLFTFLKKSNIHEALTKEPSAYYSQFLREFCDGFVDLPKKETVKARLASLGLSNEKKPNLTSTQLINSSPVKLLYFSPTWKVLM